MFFSMEAKADTPEKPVKGEKLFSPLRTATSVNDHFRLSSCQRKIKYGEFQKTSYFFTQNLFKSRLRSAKDVKM